MSLNLPPMLVSERLHYAPISQYCIPDIVKLLEDYETVYLLTYAPFPYTEKDALLWVNHVMNMNNNGYGYFWGIYDFENQFIGTIGLSVDPEHEKGELHYWLGKKYWGHGYGTEAAKRIINFAFKIKKLERLMVNCLTRNTRSEHVIKKCGFKFEGEAEHYVKRFGVFENVKFYRLLSSEFKDLDAKNIL
jgi:RimJ/RimL family protein N-acetyltransferase